MEIYKKIAPVHVDHNDTHVLALAPYKTTLSIFKVNLALQDETNVSTSNKKDTENVLIEDIYDDESDEVEQLSSPVLPSYGNEIKEIVYQPVPLSKEQQVVPTSSSSSPNKKKQLSFAEKRRQIAARRKEKLTNIKKDYSNQSAHPSTKAFLAQKRQQMYYLNKQKAIADERFKKAAKELDNIPKAKHHYNQYKTVNKEEGHEIMKPTDIYINQLKKIEQDEEEEEEIIDVVLDEENEEEEEEEGKEGQEEEGKEEQEEIKENILTPDNDIKQDQAEINPSFIHTADIANKPVGLKVESFLPANNTMNLEQSISNIDPDLIRKKVLNDNVLISTILTTRLNHFRVLSSLWKVGKLKESIEACVNAAKDTSDLQVIREFLNILIANTNAKKSFDLDCVILILPVIIRLIQSEI